MLTNIVAIFTLTFLVNALAFAFTPSFSAFTQDGVLYVTVLGDSCNEYMAGLEVSQVCDETRSEKNFALECEAELLVYQTQLVCNQDVSEPQTFEIELEPTKIAPEARALLLHYEGEVQRVEIN
jgi:hypothetical protein